MSKMTPLSGKKYIVTDQCMWEPMSQKEQREYNPYDKARARHAIQLIDPETGTVVNLMSGSTVVIVKAK